MYRVGDCVLIKNRTDTKYRANAYSEPVEIVQVNDNGTVRYSTGTESDVINIRNIHPYHTE